MRRNDTSRTSVTSRTLAKALAAFAITVALAVLSGCTVDVHGGHGHHGVHRPHHPVHHPHHRPVRHHRVHH